MFIHICGGSVHSSATMAGGLFTINALFFQEIGFYDPGLELYGAENLELSFKVHVIHKLLMNVFLWHWLNNSCFLFYNVSCRFGCVVGKSCSCHAHMWVTCSEFERHTLKMTRHKIVRNGSGSLPVWIPGLYAGGRGGDFWDMSPHSWKSFRMDH